MEVEITLWHHESVVYQRHCSETTLTGFEPGSLVMGSKRVVHWTSETW
jgi:hypothetical protein